MITLRDLHDRYGDNDAIAGVLDIPARQIARWLPDAEIPYIHTLRLCFLIAPRAFRAQAKKLRARTVTQEPGDIRHAA